MQFDESCGEHEMNLTQQQFEIFQDEWSKCIEQLGSDTEANIAG